MEIQEIKIRKIKMPLKTPFITRLETVSERESIMIEVVSRSQRTGYGEVVAFSSPWYTEETVETAWNIMTNYLVPIVLSSKIKHPTDFVLESKWLKRHSMAKAGVEMALWDLWAKEKEQSLSSIFGGKRNRIPAGLVIASKETDDILMKMEKAKEKGYQRIKLKISKFHDIALLQEVRKFFPDMGVMVDANGGYTLDDLDHLRALDTFGLILIEQPFSESSWYEHAELQKTIRTPICLDESINSFEDAVQAVQLGSARSICIKIGKFGWTEAKLIYEYCLNNRIAPWVGGMIEFGISRAHSIALASLEGFGIPGDISETSRYWEQDVTLPEVKISNGWIEVPTGAGIGFEVNQRRLEEVTEDFVSFKIKQV